MAFPESVASHLEPEKLRAAIITDTSRNIFVVDQGLIGRVGKSMMGFSVDEINDSWVEPVAFDLGLRHDFIVKGIEKGRKIAEEMEQVYPLSDNNPETKGLRTIAYRENSETYLREIEDGLERNSFAVGFAAGIVLGQKKIQEKVLLDSMGFGDIITSLCQVQKE